MAKRFPIPEFEYEELKAIAWTPPAVLDAAEVQARIDAAAGGDASAYGAYAVAAEDGYFDALNLRGEQRNAVVCVLPSSGVTMIGRSHAWKLQGLMATEGMPKANAPVLLQWKTPRPMNTRLGPDDGIPAPAQAMTLVSGHRFDDHWIGNRCAVDTSWNPGEGQGFRVLWSDEPQRNDFHSAVAMFVWNS